MHDKIQQIIHDIITDEARSGDGKHQTKRKEEMTE